LFERERARGGNIRKKQTPRLSRGPDEGLDPRI